MKELIYRDEAWEVKIRKDIEDSRQALQALLDTWNNLDLTPCTDIFSLMVQPQQTHDAAVREVTTIPIAAGRFQISKDAFLKILDVPCPNDLYISARQAKRAPFSGARDLWTIKEDKTIVLDKTLADTYIFAKNIYAANERQKEVALLFINYIESSVTINALLTELPLQHMLLPWAITGRSFPTLYTLELEPEQLRGLLAYYV